MDNGHAAHNKVRNWNFFPEKLSQKMIKNQLIINMLTKSRVLETLSGTRFE